MRKSGFRRFVVPTIVILIGVTVILVACATPTPKVNTKKVRVTREVTRVVIEVVERVVTRVVQRVVKETVIAKSTPVVVEREVTVLVQPSPQIVEIVVTPTPAPSASQTLNLRERWLDAIDPANVMPLAASQIASEAFVGLTRQNEETSQVEPGMATSWDVSDDLQVWTFNLRTDVPWVRYDSTAHSVTQVTDSNGQVRYVTAYDFEYGLKRVLDPAVDSYDAYNLYLIEGAEDYNYGSGSAGEVGVTAVDDSTLEIRLIQPAGHFDVIANLWFVVAQPEWQIEAQGESWTWEGYFEGYGPYVLQEWVDGSHLTLIKNPYWPGTDSIPRPTIQQITWWLIDDDDAAWEAYLAGELDVLEVFGDAVATAQSDPQLAAQLEVQPGLCTYYFGFNTLKPPFDDARVRLAFSLAVDRQALIDQALQGRDKAAYWFSPPGARAAPTLEDYATLGVGYEPDNARDLLAQVYPDLSQMPPISLAFNTTSSGGNQTVAEIVQGMWADALGVEVELEPVEGWSDYLDLLDADAPHIWRMTWCADFADAYNFLNELFHSTGYSADRTNWSNSTFDDLLDQAAASTDTAQRTEWYAQAEDLLVRQEAVVIPLYWYTQDVLTQPYVQRTYSQVDGMERLEKWVLLAP